MPQTLPEPPDPGVVNALRFGTQTFRFLEGVQSRFEDAVAIPVPGREPLVLVTDPGLAREVLSDPETFTRVPAQDSAALIAENGLVQSEGDLWRQQRSIIGQAFGDRQVRAYANTTGQRVSAMADRWAETGATELNLHREMTGLTIRVASEILLGEDIGADRARQFHEWMQVAGQEFEFDLDVVRPDWMPGRISPEFREAAEGIRGLSEEMIRRRRSQLAEDGDDDRPTDMLTMLIQAESQPDVEMPDDQIRDEVATFLIAGHETTALSLTYTTSLLSWHPEAMHRVREEAQSVLGDGPPTYDDIESLSFTKRAYREALRLYPPAWAVFRQASEDARLGEYDVEGGSAVIVPQWSIHRDERHFEDPDAFDPDRWARRDPDETAAYFPFSTGPHACVGRGFALSGATLVLARLLRDFDVEVPDDALEDLIVTPTLRPERGVEAKITPVDDRDDRVPQ